MTTPSAHPLLVIALAALVGCAKPPPGEADSGVASTAPSSGARETSGEAAGTPSASVSAAPKPAGKSFDTPAGAMSEVGDEIHLAGKPIYPPSDCPAGGKDGCAKVKALREGMEKVKLLRHFDGPGGQKSIVLAQVWSTGNACNGGSLFFVRVAKDAPLQYSDVFDHCGGPDPMVGAMPDKVLISVPAHAANRGTGTIAAKNMEYDIATGALKASAPAKKKR